MTPWIKRKPNIIRRSQRVFVELSEFLDMEYQAIIDEITHSSANPTHIESIQNALLEIAKLRQKINHLSHGLTIENFSTTCKQLAELSKDLTSIISDLAQEHHASRRYITQALHQFVKAEEVLSSMLSTLAPVKPEQEATELLVPTDLLYQSFQSLFPAERMLVIAGRKTHSKIVLGAGFDVTGNSTAGHVQADPKKLGQALIAMTSSNTHLAAWLHSHPGTGAIGTHPSSIDLNQHQDWLRDYSPSLLSAIFVKDRYIRFWGSAIEKSEIRIKVIGGGVTQENKNEQVYRLDA